MFRPLSLLSEVVGSNLLSLVTSGIHTDPLSIYREYIQNAADSIARSGAAIGGRVDIAIDASAMRLSMRDNGPGLSHMQACKELLPIANSRKCYGTDRGFRGIGRLSGLGLSRTVAFLTRRNGEKRVTRICWDGDSLRRAVAVAMPVKQVIEQCVTVETIPGNKYPGNFFQVEISGIARHVAGAVLNREAVRDYIGETCPVPFASNFPYVQRVREIFKSGIEPLELEIFLHGEKSPIKRRHGSKTFASGKREEKFTGFEKVTIPAQDRESDAAVGWIAHLSYAGTLAPNLGIRGIRARAGNIQIGGEGVFDHLFSEDRFNRWCVAEMHVLDPRIVPNGRRDYFEPSPHTRNLERHVRSVAQQVEKCCRSASRNRNNEKKFQSFLQSAGMTRELAESKYLSASAARKLIEQQLLDIGKFRESLGKENANGEYRALSKLEKRLAGFKAPRGRVSFDGIQPSEVETYRTVFHSLTEISTSPSEAKKTIEAILKWAAESKGSK